MLQFGLMLFVAAAVADAGVIINEEHVKGMIPNMSVGQPNTWRNTLRMVPTSFYIQW